jgi:hypothetical protein
MKCALHGGQEKKAKCINFPGSNVYINERKMEPMALETRDERRQGEKSWVRWMMKATAAKRNTNSMNHKTETRHFFYACPALDLWSVGATRKEAERKLREEMLMLLMRCSRYDELDYFLLDSCFATVEVRAS